MSILPYEHLACQYRMQDVAILLRKGHFAAAKVLWANCPYDKEYIYKAQVAQHIAETIEEYRIFLEGE